MAGSRTIEGSDVGVVGAGLAVDRRRHRPAAECCKRILDDLGRYFGSQATDPLEYADEAWSSTRWSPGGYNATMTPGTLTGVGETRREPIGRLHWAGSETALEWPGFMEGATRSGQRVATELQSDRKNR